MRFIMLTRVFRNGNSQAVRIPADLAYYAMMLLFRSGYEIGVVGRLRRGICLAWDRSKASRTGCREKSFLAKFSFIGNAIEHHERAAGFEIQFDKFFP
jgi:hypothetical protein